MADALLPDDQKTVQRLDSVACLLDWMRSMPAPTRKGFFAALAECSDLVQQSVVKFIEVIKNPRTTPVERQHALTSIADALFPSALPSGEYGRHEAAFAQRLRELMEAKQVSQQELALRVGCSQPAISQLLNRQCRPQRKTILKLAEALSVQACELWPDIEVAEMLDAIASFQQDDYEMTQAEARALGDTSRPNRPRIQSKPLPPRRR